MPDTIQKKELFLRALLKGILFHLAFLAPFISVQANTLNLPSSHAASSPDSSHKENSKNSTAQVNGHKMPVQAVPDVVIGNSNAAITVIEYSSLNCAACAHFHQTAFPVIKSRYIDTGKVRFIFRHFPLDEQAAQIAAILSCAPEIKQFTLIQRLFEQQGQWMNAPDPSTSIAEITGIDPHECKKAYSSKALADAVLQKRVDAEKAMTINGTPTFVINGRIIDHAPSLEELEPYFDASFNTKKNAKS